MAKTTITPDVLEMLLENWGLFVNSGSWGPRIANQCGSAEREWNSNLSRYVWDNEGRPVRERQCNDELGDRVERIIRDLPMDYIRVLLSRYQKNEYNMSAYNKALLVSAKVSVQEKLEEQAYA